MFSMLLFNVRGFKLVQRGKLLHDAIYELKPEFIFSLRSGTFSGHLAFIFRNSSLPVLEKRHVMIRGTVALKHE